MVRHSHNIVSPVLGALLRGEKLTSLDVVDRFKTTRLASAIHAPRTWGRIIVATIVSSYNDNGELTIYGE